MRRIFSSLFLQQDATQSSNCCAEIALFLSTLFHSTGDLVETLKYSPHGKIINQLKLHNFENLVLFLDKIFNINRITCTNA
jgi:hypothetical protein